jgi:hypothetical protein
MPPRRYSDGERAAKVARVSDAVGVGQVGSSTLARIIQQVRDNPQLVDDIRSRRDVDDAMLDVLRHVSCTLTLHTVSGAPYEWVIASMPKLLGYLLTKSEPLSQFMCKAFERTMPTPASPWHLILAEDELTPGMLMRQDNKRKTLGHYVSFQEFGHKARKHTSAWFPLAFLRSSEIKKVLGGTGAVQRALLRHLFVDGDNLRTVGMVLHIGPGRSPALVFVTLGHSVTDEAGEKNLWSTRGSSATLPCFYCKNVSGLGDKNIAPYSDTGYIVDITCPHVERFDKCTGEDIFEKCDILSELRPMLNDEQFKTAQQRLGFTYNPHGPLWDAELRHVVDPIRVNTMDASHSLFCNGVAQKELSHLFVALARHNVGFQSLRAFSDADWRTCHALGGPRCSNTLVTVFGEARAQFFKNQKEFPGSASDMLVALPVVVFFMEVNPALLAALPAEYASVATLNRVRGLYQQAKLAMPVANELAAALRLHGEQKLAAYGPAAFIPKDHYILHLPFQIERDGELLDTLVTERFHQMPKVAMDSIDNTSRFEATVLARSVSLYLHAVSSANAFETKLLGRVSDISDIIDGATASTSMIFEGTRIHRGDVLRVHGQAFMLDVCLMVGAVAEIIACRLLATRQV